MYNFLHKLFLFINNVSDVYSGNLYNCGTSILLKVTFSVTEQIPIYTVLNVSYGNRGYTLFL